MQLDMKPPVTSGSYLKRCISKFRQKRTNTRQGEEQTKQEKRKDPRIERINDCTMKRERSLDQLFFFYRKTEMRSAGRPPIAPIEKVFL